MTRSAKLAAEVPASTRLGERLPDEAPRARPRVGVALGSGSARGLAHIGVMRALAEAGIAVDVVAGTSMGAFVGAIFAAGKLDRLEAEFTKLDWSSIAALLDPVFPRSGLIEGHRIGDFMRTHVRATSIEQLPMPFLAMATDITSGEEVALHSGDLIEAVRASIAVPGIFTPVRSNGRILVDGGLVNPVPVSAARAMGADVVIAVDLNHDIVGSRAMRAEPVANDSGFSQAVMRMLDGLDSLESPSLAQFREWLRRDPPNREAPLPGIFDVLLASVYIMQARITQASLRQDRPELLIQPPLGHVRFMEFARAGEIVAIGYQSAKTALETFDRSMLA